MKKPFIKPRPDAHLEELRGIRLALQGLLRQAQKPTGATVEELNAVFGPIVTKLRSLDRKVKNRSKGELQ